MIDALFDNSATLDATLDDYIREGVTTMDGFKEDSEKALEEYFRTGHMPAWFMEKYSKLFSTPRR